MDEQEFLLHALRKRVAEVLKVEPFRVNVMLSPPTFSVLLDGKAPDSDQMQAIEQDIQYTAQQVRASMN